MSEKEGKKEGEREEHKSALQVEQKAVVVAG